MSVALHRGATSGYPGHLARAVVLQALARRQWHPVADAARWLTAGERARLATLRDAGRRRQWLAARVLAKQLILEHGNMPTDDARAINITARDSEGRGVRPEVTISGRVMPCCLSVAHTDAAVLVAISTAGGISIGVDLVKSEPPAPGFLRTWFDRAEQDVAAAGDELEVCRLWAVKEAVYKAAGRDDSFAPRRIQVRKTPAGYTCTYRGIDLADCCNVEVWPCKGHVAALAVVDHGMITCEPVQPAMT